MFDLFNAKKNNKSQVFVASDSQPKMPNNISYSMHDAITTETFQSNKIYLDALLDIVNDFMDI